MQSKVAPLALLPVGGLRGGALSTLLWVSWAFGGGGQILLALIIGIIVLIVYTS